MSLSAAQKALLKRLQRQARLPDADYRALFPAVTGWRDCDSSTDARLTQRHMDALKARLLALARPADLDAQLAQQQQPRRRLEHRLAETQRCLALYVPDVAGYVATVVADKFGVPVDGALTLDDLGDRPTVREREVMGKSTTELVDGPSQLEQLVMTLWARVQALRERAGHSLHDMRTRAGVPCDCAQCRRPATGAARTYQLDRRPRSFASVVKR